jgi:sec-independent protein translocase protein TatB
MSGVGSSELIILILIGLIVLGPKRLPQIANQLGSWIGQARRMTRAMRRQLEDELNVDENFNIKPRSAPSRAAPPSVLGDIPDPADPAYDLDAPGAHIPNDDDSFSPAHDEAHADIADNDSAAKEKDA